MQSFKTFLTTFLASVSIVLVSFAALYWLITPSQQPAGTDKNNVPITKANSSDNKTTLVSFQNGTDSIFLLIKLNAVDSKAAVTAIPPDFYITHSGRTLSESFEYAGIMQCVQDLSQHLDVTIDYHLALDSDTLPLLNASFITEETAAAVFSAEISSIAHLAAETIKNSLSELQTYVLPAIPKNFSYLYTNIGKTEATQLSRILTLLQRSNTEFTFSALKPTTQHN